MGGIQGLQIYKWVFYNPDIEPKEKGHQIMW